MLARSHTRCSIYSTRREQLQFCLPGVSTWADFTLNFKIEDRLLNLGEFALRISSATSAGGGQARSQTSSTPATASRAQLRKQQTFWARRKALRSWTCPADGDGRSHPWWRDNRSADHLVR